MFSKKRGVVLLIITTLLIGAFGMVSYGQGFSRTLKAWFGTVNIIVDGQNVTNKVEPFVVDGTTYIPLRVVAETFNKNVEWNPVTFTANITDDLTQVDGYYQNQILTRDIEIMSLESKIKKLEKELEKSDSKSKDLDDLEDDLNDEFDEYRDIEFDIKLYGDNRDIEVEIEVDLYDYGREWRRLTESRKTRYLQDIVDEILEVYPRADIEGFIIDIDKKDTILEFDIRRDKVEIKEKYSSADISDLEKDLDDNYYNYFKDINLRITLDGDEDDVEFIVEIDYDKFEDEWDDLRESSIKRFMSNIYEDVEYELGRSSKINGYVYDYSNKKYLARYYLTSGGREVFNRY